MVTFERLAPHYRWIETIVFGQSLQRCRVAMLPHVKSVQRILIVGEGNGRFLSAFLAVNATAIVDCVDLSAKMLELAQRKVSQVGGAEARVKFIVGNVLELPIAACTYDLIATNFLLDCFEGEKLQAVIDRLAAMLKPTGLWIVGDFRRPQKAAPRRRAKLALALMYRCFRIATGLDAKILCDPAPLLKARGFEMIAQRNWQNGFLSAQLWQLNTNRG